MNLSSRYSRRTFLGAAGAMAGALAIPAARSAIAPSQARTSFELGGFTKPFQRLSFEATAEFVAAIGWQGVECPVRKGGQIEPQDAEDRLPEFVAALKERGLKVFSIATDVRDLRDPLSEKVVRAAARSGIPIYRLAHLHYDHDRPLSPQIEGLRKGFAELSDLNRELGVVACYENHSGATSVGAPLWDLHEIFADLDPRAFGICLDVGHATVEGGYAWRTNLQRVAPLVREVYIKDFAWEKTNGDWKAAWRPLGEGMLDPEWLPALRRRGFAGPIVQHHEYPLPEVGPEMSRLMRRDLSVLKEWLRTEK